MTFMSNNCFFFTLYRGQMNLIAPEALNKGMGTQDSFSPVIHAAWKQEYVDFLMLRDLM